MSCHKDKIFSSTLGQFLGFDIDSKRC